MPPVEGRDHRPPGPRFRRPGAAERRRRARPAALLAGFGAALAFLVAVGTAVAVWQLREAALRDAGRELTALDVALAEQAGRVFQGVDQLLAGIVEQLRHEGIATPDDLRRLRTDIRVHDALRERVKGLPQLDAVTLIDDAGDLVNFSRSWPVPPVNVADRDYYEALRNATSARSFVSAPVQNRGTGTWTIYLARRIEGEGGRFIGLALGAIELGYFEEYFRSVGAAAEGTITLWRRDGVLLARNEAGGGADAVGKTYATVAQREVLPHAEAGVFRTVSLIDRLPRVVAVRAVKGYPLMVSVSRAEAAVLADWPREALLAGGGGAVAVLAIALSVWALARRFAAEAAAARARALAEEAGDARARAEAASRAKSEFLANMSHELRTPLNAVLGFSEIIGDATMGPVDPRYQDYARDINKAGSHLLAIINDVLDLSKLEAGHLELNEAPVDLAAAARACRLLVRGRAESARVALEIEADPAAPLVRGDELRLKQIILNLMANAVKFTLPGGRVLVSLTVPAPAEGGGLALTVADTGIGMRLEEIAQALEPFVQVDSDMSRRYEGAGLGLPLVKRLVELHGGTLLIDSEPGCGTTVRVILPAERVIERAA